MYKLHDFFSSCVLRCVKYMKCVYFNITWCLLSSTLTILRKSSSEKPLNGFESTFLSISCTKSLLGLLIFF